MLFRSSPVLKEQLNTLSPKTEEGENDIRDKGLLAGQETVTSSRWEGEEQEDGVISAPNLQSFCCCIPSSYFLGPLYCVLSSQELPSLGICTYGGLGKHRLGKIRIGIMLFLYSKIN